MRTYFRSRHFRAYHNIRQFWNYYRYIIIYVIGIAAGAVGIIMFADFGSNEGDASGIVNDLQLNIFDTAYQKAIASKNINYLELWKNTLTVRFRDMIILLILGFARYFEIWIGLFILLEGILTGIVGGVSFVSMGNWGILIAIAAMFPHFIIYIAAVFLLIKFFHKEKYPLKNTAAIICIIIMLVLVGTFVESFINPHIQRWLLYQIRNFI